MMHSTGYRLIGSQNKIANCNHPTHFRQTKTSSPGRSLACVTPATQSNPYVDDGIEGGVGGGARRLVHPVLAGGGCEDGWGLVGGYVTAGGAGRRTIPWQPVKTRRLLLLCTAHGSPSHLCL
jgi:hypothetical protein